MILLVDHQDSFTRNLEHQLSFLDEVLVQDRRKITEKSIEAAQLIVLSPGPGKPRDYPETIEIVSKTSRASSHTRNLFGISNANEMDGASIIRQSQVLHGVCTEISTDTESSYTKFFFHHSGREVSFFTGRPQKSFKTSKFGKNHFP